MLPKFDSEGAVTTVQVVETSVTVNNSRELKQRRRRQQRERQKTIGLDWQNNNFACALRFFVHSLPSLNDYDVKMPNFTLLVEDANTRQQLAFFSWTSIQSFRTQLQKKLPTFDEMNKTLDAIE